MVHVFCRLDVITLVRDVARVCSAWRGLLDYDAIFQRIFTRQFGANAALFKQELDLDNITWRTLVRLGRVVVGWVSSYFPDSRFYALCSHNSLLYFNICCVSLILYHYFV